MAVILKIMEQAFVNTVIGKFFRKNHVQTVKHWMFGQAMEKNELER